MSDATRAGIQRYNAPMSSFNAPSYQIEKSSGQCAITGRQLEPGETYIATLIEDGEGFQRLDVAKEAWDANQRPEKIFSFWQTTVPEPNASKKVFVDDAVLMNLLTRLGEDDAALSEQRIAFRFVLALILMRKKLLRYDRTESRAIKSASAAEVDGEGGDAKSADYWLMTPKLDVSKGIFGKWADEPLAIRDPHLDEEQIRGVTDQLGQILNAELQ